MPATPIDRLVACYRNHLHLPDPGPMYVLMGAVAANMIDGVPCWLMLIGPPSCGKSELLNSLLGVPHMVEAADIGGDAAFLSGSSRRDWAPDATGGLLRQVGDHGSIVLNDFTSVLSKPQDKMAGIMAVFRECYGGRWTRSIGGEGGRALTWAGRLGLFAGSTGVIDQHHKISAELGERWIYYRFEERDVFQDVMMALSNSRNGWRDELRGYAVKFFDDLGLGFSRPQKRRDLASPERLRLHDLASLAARCRSSVTRDTYSHEIIGARETELAIRLSATLAQLLIGMDFIGVDAKTIWSLLAKVAMDSMPRLRSMTLQAVSQSSKSVSVDDLHKVLGCSLSVVKRVVEDLEMHKIVERACGRVFLSAWTRERYRRFVV
jgi:hypothetical protein